MIRGYRIFSKRGLYVVINYSCVSHSSVNEDRLTKYHAGTAFVVSFRAGAWLER